MGATGTQTESLTHTNLMPPTAAKCGSSSHNPRASGSRHLPPARVHALFASRVGLAASAASPSPRAFCLARRARGICRQPIASRFLPRASGSRHLPPAHSLALSASRVGLAASAASPSPRAFCLARRARGSCRQPIASRFLPPASGSRQLPPARVNPLFASRVGLAASAASPSPRAFCLARRARGICRQPESTRFLPRASGSRHLPPAHSLALITLASLASLARFARSPHAHAPPPSALTALQCPPRRPLLSSGASGWRCV